MISTHTPHARRDRGQELFRGISRISTHTPHARRDRTEVFQPSLNTISTHTPHARRDQLRLEKSSINTISTHTPHARRDSFSCMSWRYERNFNSHASCEAWLLHVKFVLRHPEFQLTRLMRGVTRKEKDLTKLRKFQLTRLMRGVTIVNKWVDEHPVISTHTPHARRDTMDDMEEIEY